MKGHLYRITVERIEDNKGNPVDDPALVFETKNHDNLLMIAEKVKEKKLFEDSSEAVALVMGMKLLGEVMLHHRDHELFQQFKPHFAEFMQGIKKS